MTQFRVIKLLNMLQLIFRHGAIEEEDDLVLQLDLEKAAPGQGHAPADNLGGEGSLAGNAPHSTNNGNPENLFSESKFDNDD